MSDLKYRVVTSFNLLFIRAEEIENSRDKVRLLFACAVRVGSGSEVRNLSAQSCSEFLGGIWRSKILKSTGVAWKKQGLSLVPGNYYQVDAAIDNFSISNEKGRRSDGLWYEIIGAPVPLKESPIFKTFEQNVTDDLNFEETSDAA